MTRCSARSRAPAITANRAPERFACRSWALSDRPAKHKRGAYVRSTKLTGYSRCLDFGALAKSGNEDIDCAGLLRRETLLAQVMSHPLEAHAEADAGSWRPADLFDQPVVSSTGEDGDLRTVGMSRHDLKHGVRVVVGDLELGWGVPHMESRALRGAI